ncbi:NUDIX domain protein [uncultured archaeon]|nr:NUDIX domain protein [uncultured archaeon]
MAMDKGMKEIHKIAAVVIKDDGFLMVRKTGKDICTSLGGKPEEGETEEQALVREISEELSCGANVIRKLGDFTAKAVFDDAMVRLSAYLVELKGEPKISDPELEEYAFITKDYKKKGINLPDSIEKQVIPYCKKEGLLNW